MQFGEYRIEIVSESFFRLDGGAMHGVVPFPLWSKANPPDEINRIKLGCNCLFIETPREKILIETGMGDKWSEKLAKIYAVEHMRPFAEALKAATNYSPEDITIVVNTHLHFDHAGGNTTRDKAGELVPMFPNARYLISRGEYEHAESPTERDRASYIADDWRPLKKTGQLELMPQVYEVVPGLTLETVPGHNRTMQCVRLEQHGKTLYGFVDLVPTRAHVSFAWIMGYDLYPLESLESKKRLLPQAAREDWLCLLYHDPNHALFRIVEEDGKLRAFEEKK
ncbi:MAG: MBL fold metallo-hydrolase [Pyrinomonadaceae bacterium]